MNNIRTKHYSVIKRISGMLFQLHDGDKITHSELVNSANQLLHMVLRGSNAVGRTEYELILKEVINLYEEEVGIKTYMPTIISKDQQSKYWLYKVKPTIPHPFFERYKLYLSKDGFQQKAIQNIEATCEETLAYCANPRSTGGRDRKRGMVVGDVQSGKTANYLGLINMAFDYGYKIVVLLAGGTNTLREQTQMRTDKGVIGAKSDTIGNNVEYIGVGFNTHEHYAVPFTNHTNDFKKFIQKNLNTAIGDLNKPVVLVVKKIKSVLESVSERLQSELTDKGLDSKSILIIDDEADYASVNTKKQDNPTTINAAIRDIFNKFPIATYVGYTATPFANIFINPYDTEDDYLDLFPSDFIVQLNAPDIYFGGRKVFPKDIEMQANCLRYIYEEEPLFLPVVHKKYDQYFGLAESLKEAIHTFIINNVIRTLRGDAFKHRSMMINITRFNEMQEQIHEKVCGYVEQLSDEIAQLSSYSVERFIENKDMKKIYDLFNYSDFYKNIREGIGEDNETPISWNEIQDGLFEEIKQFKVVVVNSRNGKMKSDDNKRFNYEDFEKTGARAIVIGGLVLSRGLTLEGLMVSYYSRNAGAYDTLLQMCRWFGYRPHYSDLCRIYLTETSVERFDAALDAVEDLKDQFNEMKIHGKQPKDFGLLVKESPDILDTTLLVTARNKMKNTDSITYTLNYGGVYADTSKLSRDPAINIYNKNLLLNFASKNEFSLKNDQYLMTSLVSKFEIADLIRKLKIPYINKKFDTEGLSEYIENSDIFPYWDVVIARGHSEKTIDLPNAEEEKHHAVERSFRINGDDDMYIRIGGTNNRVLDPSILNAGLWLSEQKQKEILAEKSKNDPKQRKYSTLSALDYLKRRDNPILVIYPIDLKTELNTSENSSLTDNEKIEVEESRVRVKDNFDGELLYAFAIGFPKKESPIIVKYRANMVKLDELASNIEIDDDEEGFDIDED